MINLIMTNIYFSLELYSYLGVEYANSKVVIIRMCDCISFMLGNLAF